MLYLIDVPMFFCLSVLRVVSVLFFGKNIANGQLSSCSSSASDVNTAGGRSFALVASCCGVGRGGQSRDYGFFLYGWFDMELNAFSL